ncbi:PRC-barrel domain-containing protein [Leptospira interrogans]
MKRTSVAIVSILAASIAAFAQTQTTTPPPATNPPAATTGADNQSTYYTQQQGEFRASDLIGATVRNAANERIGEIEELVLSPDGRVMAAVIGVGGFLGIGERDVALDFKSLRIERDSSAMTQRGSFVVQINATKESLQNAPEWKDPTKPAGK